MTMVLILFILAILSKADFVDVRNSCSKCSFRLLSCPNGLRHRHPPLPEPHDILQGFDSGRGPKLFSAAGPRQDFSRTFLCEYLRWLHCASPVALAHDSFRFGDLSVGFRMLRNTT
ncbi:hypothetical protein QBC37DRAFT_430547 [Rhypophila decipiens]|uniref:Secreted protein n=1 Tax=Rhypophila decipiens TaxID=261697 RepID=A0AAN6XYK6_9PEZI|nr:hypothetical protein QBC37DRAFT_430547 [Rhypophila decipiens]